MTSGRRISHYELLEELGSGGMGVVYRAHDLKLGRSVALKFLPPRLLDDPIARERFLREARAASAIDHPNICTIHEVDEAPDGRIFFAMALYEGETLRARIARGPVPTTQAQQIAIAVASGLVKAHRQRIIHRDIKPANIMLTSDGAVKILDFGLAKLADDPAITKTGMIMGSTPYMSPEQVRGDPIDHRTDIWSVGVVLIEMLTGEPPFCGESERAIFQAILEQQPRFPSTDPARARLLAVASRCLRKKAEERYQTCDDLLADLRSDADAFESASTLQAPAREDSIASIAVLPFADMSPGHDQEYFCEGVAEEILNTLTRVEGLRVASRTSSFQFKRPAEDVRRIGERLNVRSILEGSVRKAGNQLRVTVQLINCADGYHLWSERYDRKLEDVFAIQDDIAESAARALRVVLSGQEATLRRAPKTDLEAYEFYLRGRQRLNEFTRRSVLEAREMFTRAAEIDPQYVLAQSGIADASGWLVMWFGGTESDLRQAEQASARALELAGDLAESHAARVLVLMLARRYAEAEKHFLRAIELNARSFEAYYYYARALFSAGRIAEAATMMRKAAELRPEDYQTPGLLSMMLRKLGRMDEAKQAALESQSRVDRWLEINPRDARAWYHGALRLVELGRGEEASKWIERAIDLEPDDPAVLYNAACVYSLNGEPDRALELLEKITRNQQGFGTTRDWVANDPDLDPLRELPRFQAILNHLS